MDEHERRLEQHAGEVRAADHGQHAEPAAERAAGHRAHAEGGHAAHGARGAHGGHGDHAAQFRDRFWISLVLAVPVVAFSEMFSDLLGYTVPRFLGSSWISPVLGTVLFVYGGRPFLRARSAKPGPGSRG
jgi:P-type Cu2+ transporter